MQVNLLKFHYKQNAKHHAQANMNANSVSLCLTLGEKATIHQVTTMLATSKNVLYPGHNHLLTTSTYDPSLADTRAIIKVLDHQCWWLWPLNRTFLEVDSMVVTWWIVAFCAVLRDILKTSFH